MDCTIVHSEFYLSTMSDLFLHLVMIIAGYFMLSVRSPDFLGSSLRRLILAKSGRDFLLRVFFDLCGFPALLRSDRGSAFTGMVVQSVNELLGVTHVFVTAFHPQSRGYLEARHNTIYHPLAAYCSAHPSQWPRFAKLAQWSMRATPGKDRGGFSPYGLVTGLKAQGLIDSLLKRTSDTETLDPSTYVSLL